MEKYNDLQIKICGRRTDLSDFRLICQSISFYFVSVKALSHWWNSDETAMEQWWNSLNQHQTGWIRAMKQWWNMLNQDETAMKQFVSWSWNTVKHVESGWNMVMKHIESGCNSVSWSWNTLNQDETVCFMVMKHAVSCQWNTLNQGRWPQIYLFFILIFGSWCFTALFHSVSFFFIAVSLLFHCYFMLSHCCFMLFHAVSLLFHDVSSLCFMVFQGVWLPCFILFLDHETGAVGTSLNAAVYVYRWSLFVYPRLLHAPH